MVLLALSWKLCRYSHEWKKTVRRAGRWIDFDNDYKTLNLEFMETVWWVFSQISKQDLVYRGMKVLPSSPQCNKDSSSHRIKVGILLRQDL